MLKLKDGVLLAGNKYINAMLTAVQLVYNANDWLVVITSGRDSHETGYHPEDRAVDVRFWDVPPERRREIGEKIKALLPGYYDLVIEKDHFHIEADAKKEHLS